ncbi:TetR/AcrR family transcriptional regulator [Nocardia huaxiensis]|uniref:TetR/AcrR family transcriptional regulator n=1 Tax=Nocardia huaxiensis TaxID=2755382 RepID=A0A7D6Z8R0_9NOCA|nr:TetR/AcrR family transcriptional regulator [Nocardia huaxiensis]QLY27798.1 TetR/AcrR family transcriptional regulator [Nocardia huaxiensis]UFS98807.1 TetR/AcrR family transcriptional regulator [Nocardia huaxiensis]
MTQAAAAAVGTPRRGRPPQTEEQADQVRARIVLATAVVFAEQGSRGLSVARIIERAGLARPTFYRYFANATEPLHAIMATSNEDLVSGIGRALEDTIEPVQLGINMIEAYLYWARGHGPMLAPLFAELHDQASPVFGYRDAALSQIRDLVHRKFAEIGRPAPTDLALETAMQICEFVVYRISAGAPDAEPDPTTIAEARTTMIRGVLAMLGRREDVEYALALPGFFDAGTP